MFEGDRFNVYGVSRVVNGYVDDWYVKYHIEDEPVLSGFLLFQK